MIRNHQFENSSMLSNCEYNDETEELTVTFTNGKDYTYIEVPKLVYDELINSESVGRYFNSIKGMLKVKR